jgi:hypothetical protein
MYRDVNSFHYACFVAISSCLDLHVQFPLIGQFKSRFLFEWLAQFLVVWLTRYHGGTLMIKWMVMIGFKASTGLFCT